MAEIGHPCGDVLFYGVGRLRSPLQAPPKLVQGPLVRRHDKLEGGKKSGDRKWIPTYVVLYKGMLYFYKENPALFADKQVRPCPARLGCMALSRTGRPDADGAGAVLLLCPR